MSNTFVYSAIRGSSGYSGLTGNTGVQGAQGISGYSGFSGISGANATTVSITYSNSFTAGQAIYRITGGYALGQANSVSAADILGVVTSSTGTAFTYVANGYATGFTGLVDAANYYLSETTAGALTTNPPSAVGMVIKPVLIAIGSTAAQIVEYPGAQVQPAGSNSGYSGFSGLKGSTGAQGAQGTAGTNGIQGAQGASGYSGFSGAFAGTGVSGYGAMFTGTNSLSTNSFFFSGGNVGLGTTSPSYPLMMQKNSTSGTRNVLAQFYDGNFYPSGNPTINLMGWTPGGNNPSGDVAMVYNILVGLSFGVSPLGGGTPVKYHYLDCYGQTMLGTTTAVATGSGSLTVGATTASTSTTTGALTVAGGLGVGGALNVGGNVAIGTTPSAWSGFSALDIGGGGSIAGSSLETIILQNAYFNGSNLIYKNTGYATFYDLNNGQFIWKYALSGTAGTAITFTEAMRINGNGNVGIGTASPAYTLDLSGSARIVTSLGVGTTPSGTTGEIRATGNITAYYSDDRLKTKLGVIENALDKICSLEGFYYEANETAQALGYEPVREVGISAQATQKVLPEIVAPAPIDEKYLTIRYERLAPLLIEAIKELREENKLLREEIKALK